MLVVRMLACLLCLSLAASGAKADDSRILEARLSTGPHAPGDAPDVIVHVPAGYDARAPLDLVVFLHGFDGCTRALVATDPIPCRAGEPAHRTWKLAALHTQAHTNTLLIVPQLAYLARTAKGHRFNQPGAFDGMLRELLAGPLLAVLGPRDLTQVRSVTLIAHSAGYAATAAILRDTKRVTAIANVVLLDALYAGWHVFAEWLKQSSSHRLISLYTAQAQTQAGNHQLQLELGPHGAQLRLESKVEDAVRTHPRLIARVSTAHGDMPEAHFAEVVRGLMTAVR